jgi:hypothetical protein
MADPEDASPPPRTPLQLQATRLFNERQYKSCELVALCELSQWMNSVPTHNVYAATTLEILGDCAANTERHRQANDYYRDA